MNNTLGGKNSLPVEKMWSILAQRIITNVSGVGFAVIFQEWQVCADIWTWNQAAQLWMKDIAIVAVHA
jgi:hypothetical protein